MSFKKCHMHFLNSLKYKMHVKLLNSSKVTKRILKRIKLKHKNLFCYNHKKKQLSSLLRFLISMYRNKRTIQIVTAVYVLWQRQIVSYGFILFIYNYIAGLYSKTNRIAPDRSPLL